MKFGDFEYSVINPEYLFTSEGRISFDIYSLREIKGVKQPVLLVSKDTYTSEIRKILAERRHGKIYIQKQASRDYEMFLERSIGELIGDKKVSVQKKSKLIYSCASTVMADVFTDPRSGENIARTKTMTNNVINFILSNQQSIVHLLNMGSHDYYTFTHCVNVAVFGVGLWNVINKGGSAQELHEFAFGCMMHDVGKSKIHDNILKKPGRLTKEEFDVIKSHPVSGYDLMYDIAPQVSLDVILHHHEKCSGDGYPDGLKDGEISDNAKISAIADVYDALTTNRPYSDARRPYNAIMMMKEQMVGHFEQDKFIKFIQFLGGRNN